MKKKLNLYTALSLIIILSVGCTGSNNAFENTLKQRHINGKVKETNDTFYYETYNDDGTRGPKLKMTSTKECTYDKKGRLESDLLMNLTNEIVVTTSIEYSSDHSTSTMISLNENGDEIYKTIFEYNSDGLITGETYYFCGKFDYRAQYDYDMNNQLSTKTKYDKNDQLDSITYFEYDEKGNSILERTENADNFMNYKLEKTYDAHNNVIEEVKSYWKYIDLDTCYEYQYDKENNWISLSITENNVLVEKILRNISYY